MRASQCAFRAQRATHALLRLRACVRARGRYVLAFAIIMLNTDAHSSQIKNRMTLDQFISNNRGINAGSDLPAQLLSAVYHDITHREIKTGYGPIAAS